MRKILFLLPFVLLGNNLLHPEDPKERNHNSLGFGVAGEVAISEGIYYVGQTGSSLNNGSVYIYSPNGIGGMDQEEILAPIHNGLGFQFGHSVAVYNDLMIIGSPHLVDEVGRAYLYRKDRDGHWKLIKTIIPDGGSWTEDFGAEVSINENIILIADRNASHEQGKVFTLYRNANTGEWAEGNVIYFDAINEDGFFGHSIALDGNRAIIGSRDGNVAVAYTIDAENKSWTQEYVFSPYRYQSKGRHGFAVDLVGNYAVIGSPGFDQTGHVEVHQLKDGNWEKIQTISNPESVVESYFGASVSLNNNKLLIGNYNGEKAYVYSAADKVFTIDQTIVSPDQSREGKFGRSVALSDDRIMIGATYGEKAYIYNKSSDGEWTGSNTVSSDNRTFSITGEKVSCSGGKAGDYDCSSLDLYAFLTPNDLSGTTKTELNDIWGWTDSTTGKEYALVGLRNGTSFVDVSDPLNPFVVGFLPTATNRSTWRDMKVYKNHVYIVADFRLKDPTSFKKHGVQVFDLTQLRGVTSFTVYDMTYHYKNVGAVHNIAINEETGFAYAVGVSYAENKEYKCGKGLHMMDLSTPEAPTFAGCFAHEGTGRAGTGYTHDAQVVVYNGPDQDYQGKEIAFSCNETALSIADISDKSNPVIISKFEDINFGYIHQGWLTEDQKYFFVNDELNELYGTDDTQTTLIFDLSDLDNPQILTVYDSGLNTIDHNNYVKGDLLFQSNYSTGLRVLNVKDPANPVEIANFDTYPSGDRAAFVGSWSNYPYFSSGTIVMTSIEEGLYILKASEGGSLAAGDDQVIPEVFSLKQNYPNPFNPTTRIEYELPVAGEVTLTVFNMLGMEVMQLDRGMKRAGVHHVSLDGSHLPSGIYFYQLRSGSFVKTRKMSLIK